MSGVRIEWQAAECWVGVRWAHCADSPWRRTDVWICLLPCVPIHLWWNQEV
jgi:hypothetical protein